MYANTVRTDWPKYERTGTQTQQTSRHMYGMRTLPHNGLRHAHGHRDEVQLRRNDTICNCGSTPLLGGTQVANYIGKVVAFYGTGGFI